MAPASKSINIICVICHQHLEPVFKKNGVPIQECKACRYRAAEISSTAGHTKRLYNDNYFSGGADGYLDYLQDKESLLGRGRWYSHLLAKYGIQNGRLLDVGAAAGVIASGFRSEGWKAEGLEPNQSMVHYGRQQLDLTMHHGSLESMVIDTKFDVISMIQVLAHLTDPAAAFRHASQMTKPGGHWLIKTWNYQSLSARIFRKSWHQYSPPRTLHWFTSHSLNALAAQFQMKFVASGGPQKSISAQHAKSLLRHATSESAFLKFMTCPAALLPDRLMIPYLADDLSWYLFQNDN
ncbi:MAG: class I SAM-dependent methyltransferase [Fuerstiella sp.]